MALIAGALFYLSHGYTEMAGSDMWWHIAAGRELVQTGTLWMVDDWSYTALGKDWLNHEWLADLIYYGWVSLWGVASLVYWKWLVLITTFLLLQFTLSRRYGHIAGLLCAGLAVAIAAPFIDVRPHLYSLLCFCFLLFVLLEKKPRLWLLMPLFLVWVNLHGGFFFGLMALGVLLFPWRDFRLAVLPSIALVFALCLVAAMANPSGIGTFLYPLKYAFDDTSPFRQLAEWLSPFEAGGIRSPLFFTFMWAPIAALLYLIPAVRSRTGVPWEGMALTALTLAMALTSRRFIPLFAISLSLLLAPLVGLLLSVVRDKIWEALIVLGFVCFAVWRVLPFPLQAQSAFHYLTAEYMYPIDMVDFIEANDLQGNVFAYYNWGGYLHWRTDGGMRVYIDGRADTIYDAQTYNNYVHILSSGEGWLERIEASRPDFILWPQQKKRGQEKLAALLATKRWHPIYQDSQSWLLAHGDTTLTKPMVIPTEGPWQLVSKTQLGAWERDAEKVIAYGTKVRKQLPWHKDVCGLVIRAHLVRGENEIAESVRQDCYRHFPHRGFR